MDRKEDIRKELEGLSPFLAGLKKEQPFEVPRNYFEQLPEEILEQVRPVGESDKETAGPGWLDRLFDSLSLLLQPQYALSLATVALLIVVGIFMLRPATVDNQVATLEEEPLNSETIQAYIAANIEDFETDLLWEMSLTGAESGNTSMEEQDNMDLYIDEIIDDLDDADLEELL